jgi:pimeloyl-ACP methyl ester carboxylesterase
MTPTERPAGVINYPAGAGSAYTRVLEAGSGDRTVLMLHGVGARADRWLANLTALAAAGLHTYAIDFPGHGFAEKGGAPDYSVAGFADFVLEVMDTLHLPSCSLVGTSLGGHVAARIAADAPDRVRSLTLVGPMGMVPTGATVRRALAKSIVETSREGIAKTTSSGVRRRARHRVLDRRGMADQQLAGR